MGLGLRFLASSLLSAVTQGTLTGLGYVTDQVSASPAQPVFNLSPYYSGLFGSLLTMLPGVGGWFSSLPEGLLSVIVDFVAGWVLLGALLFACFALIGKAVGMIFGVIVGFMIFALVFGIIKL